MWTKLDDGYPDHPKILAAGPLAAWLHTCALCYCNRLLTDGFIPIGQIRKLADVDGPYQLVEVLLEVGLWERVENGYIVHDFHDVNPTAEEVKAKREELSKARAEAGRKGAIAKWQKDGNLPADLSSTLPESVNGKTMAPTRPVQTLTQPSYEEGTKEEESTNNVTLIHTSAASAAKIDNFTPWAENLWSLWPARNGKKLHKGKALDALKKIPARDWDLVTLAVENFADSSQAARGYAPDMFRWVRDGQWKEWQEPEQAQPDPKGLERARLAGALNDPKVAAKYKPGGKYYFGPKNTTQ